MEQSSAVLTALLVHIDAAPVKHKMTFTTTSDLQSSSAAFKVPEVKREAHKRQTFATAPTWMLYQAMSGCLWLLGTDTGKRNRNGSLKWQGRNN